jgi:hypothetical protein
MNELMKHQASKSHKVQSSDGSRKALIITSQATEASDPCKTALDHPTTRQQDEPTFGFGKFDHFQRRPFSRASPV